MREREKTRSGVKAARREAEAKRKEIWWDSWCCSDCVLATHTTFHYWTCRGISSLNFSVLVLVPSFFPSFNAAALTAAFFVQMLCKETQWDIGQFWWTFGCWLRCALQVQRTFFFDWIWSQWLFQQWAHCVEWDCKGTLFNPIVIIMGAIKIFLLPQWTIDWW